MNGNSIKVKSWKRHLIFLKHSVFQWLPLFSSLPCSNLARTESSSPSGSLVGLADGLIALWTWFCRVDTAGKDCHLIRLILLKSPVPCWSSQGSWVVGLGLQEGSWVGRPILEGKLTLLASWRGSKHPHHSHTRKCEVSWSVAGPAELCHELFQRAEDVLQPQGSKRRPAKHWDSTLDLCQLCWISRVC